MTTNKDFKRLVRARMTKTGESYTSARLRLLRKAAPPAPAKVDYAKLAGMSDATIKAKTGCDWKRWVGALDYVAAYEWPHREIAAYVRDKFHVPDWWTQWVTTGYERIKGLRAIGQRRGGGFEVNKSKVFAVPVARLFRSFSEARARRRWLEGVNLTVRTATRAKSMRIRWPDETRVDVYFTAKGAGKSAVAIQHRQLPDKAAADAMKQFWRERLTRLSDQLL
jgi:hypothetical protein